MSEMDSCKHRYQQLSQPATQGTDLRHTYNAVRVLHVPAVLIIVERDTPDRTESVMQCIAEAPLMSVSSDSILAVRPHPLMMHYLHYSLLHSPTLHTSHSRI